MKDHEKRPQPGFCEISLKRIDDVLNSTAGAMLSLQQFDEVTRLRRQIRALCEDGHEEEASRAADAAMAILRPLMKEKF